MAVFISLLCSCKTNYEAGQILEKAGIKGGLIVHLGCNDGRLTADLGQKASYVVQGLEVDEKMVRQARKTIRASGQYGRISVMNWDGKHLPYAENLVNLIVAQDPGAVEPEEMMRVLVPDGVALIKQGGNWVKKVKPWPVEIDEWPQYFYGPDNNAVSQDKKVGPPQCMQWVCGPAYARSHEINSSMAAMVSAKGRIFYIWDEGPLGQPEKNFPSQWSLIARDGFNGMPLWKVPMHDWGWRQWHEESSWEDPRERARMLRQLPRTTTRRLVAEGERLYVTLGYQAPVSVLDAATGDLMHTIEGTHGADEVLLESQMLFICVRETDHPDHSPGKDFRLSQNPGRIMAVDLEKSRVLWQSEPDTMMPLTLAIRGDHVYYARHGQVVCLDRADGQIRWQSEPVKGKGQNGTLVAHDKVVLFAYGPVVQLPEKRDYQVIRYHQAHTFSAESGEKLWSSPLYRGPSGNGLDIFVIDGLAWFGVDNQENLPDHWQDATTQRVGYDLLTGEEKRKVSVPKLTSPGHHYRCYRSKATERFLLLPKRGVEFLDLERKDHMRNDWLRAPCTYGVMPANGILYTAPHQCVCYQGVLMSNFNALTARQASDDHSPEITRDPSRLIKGPQYGQEKMLHPDYENSPDWPMYRHDPRRSGRVNTDVPQHPDLKWEATFVGALTPPVVADRTLLVAEKNAHTVYALEAKTGRRRWQYTASARIDSPPTIYGPLVLFGSSDGWVYCLDISDGKEIWRFFAAPRERLVGAFGQLESAWPVHGSVVVQPDVTSNPERPLVYFTAGRSTYLDGGIYAYALDPWTGELVHQICLRGPHPDPYQDLGGAGYMDGAKSDILVSDGADLFLHQERFRSDLKRFPASMQQMVRESGGFRVFPPAPERGSSARHLISTRGFLDNSYNEGTYWTYGDRWPGWDRKMRNVPFYGQILSFDNDRVYGVNVFYADVRVRLGFFPGTTGYRLFARDHDAEKDRWSVYIPVRVRAMVAAGDKLFVAGPPDVMPGEDPLAAFEGRMGSYLWSHSVEDGRKLAEIAKLSSVPVYDGLIAADRRLYMSLKDGRLVCYGR
jgi:outer membrane protein assembly factor BamB